MTELHEYTITEVGERLKRKDLSPVELVKHILLRIDAIDGKINSFITVMKETAIESAKRAERELFQGNIRGPLHGVPIALKDLLYTKGVRTTAGSKLLESFVPSYNATVVDKLQKAGAILIGKLNMHEFAFGKTNENPHYGNVRNPWDVTRIAGGSSGGNGAAVAAGLCFAAIGSDTGGSIRTPAAFCGIVGLKPTFGRVSKYGVIPLSWSLDHLGPMTRSVEDAAIILEIISGFDKNDPTTVKKEAPNYSSSIYEGIEGLRIGVPINYFFDEIDSEVKQSVTDAMHNFEKMGAKLVEVEIPELEHALYSLLLTIRSEATAYHQDTLIEQPHVYGKDVLSSLLVGQLITAAQYIKVQQAKRTIQEGFAREFNKVDVIAAPTVTMTAPKIGESIKRMNGVEKLISSELVRMAAPANLTGIPSISIPIALSSSNLPIAMQIMGKPFDERTIIRVAAAYEQKYRLTNRVPLS